MLISMFHPPGPASAAHEVGIVLIFTILNIQDDEVCKSEMGFSYARRDGRRQPALTNDLTETSASMERRWRLSKHLWPFSGLKQSEKASTQSCGFSTRNHLIHSGMQRDHVAKLPARRSVTEFSLDKCWLYGELYNFPGVICNRVYES